MRAQNGSAEDIKIIAEIQKSGFVGEAFTYEIKLLSLTPDISNVRMVKNPVFPDNLKVIQGTAGNGRPSTFKEKGKSYYSWTISRYFVIPEKGGKFNIGKGEFVVFIPREKIIHDRFWGNRKIIDYEEVRLECNEISFKANKLPDFRDSSDFSGCTGDFTIEGWFPPGRIIEGKEAYAVFSITGTGSLENLKIPNLHKIFSKGCKLKEVEQSEEPIQRNGRLYSQITLTCVFVADSDNFEIDPLCLTFFNPDTKKYYNACSETLHGSGKLNENRKREDNKDAIAI